MNDASTATGKVVVHRTMSLDGFIAGPGDSMDWIFEYPTRTRQRRSWRPRAPSSPAGGPTRSDSATPGSQPARPTKERGRERSSCVTHQPPTNPRDPAVTFLTGDIGDAIATAKNAGRRQERREKDRQHGSTAPAQPRRRTGQGMPG
jgi:hypothetical protein